ncbi:MAG: hypothetical protein ABR955_02750 [Verrucomicrobiota bacterium]|jgi:hypothetical protein
MKLAVKVAICLAGGLALNAGLRAADVVLTNMTDNPYAPIVIRNVFGLNPPPPPVAPVKDDEPLPKITPNGIMSIFGRLQVLFKVDSVAKPGKPSEEQSYILTEGQQQDDIEIVKISEKAAKVTFNNHGTIQEIALNADDNTPASGTTMSPYPPNEPGHHRFGGRFSNRGWKSGSPGPTFGDYSPPPGQQPMSQPSGNQQPDGQQPNSQYPGNQPFGSQQPNDQQPYSPYATPQNPLAGQIPPGMTPEEQTVEIEANREATKQQVMDGTMPPLPITEVTPSDAVGPGGNPVFENGNNPMGDGDTSGNGDTPPQ